MNKKIISGLLVPTLTFLGIVLAPTLIFLGIFAAGADPPQASPPTADRPHSRGETRSGIYHRFVGALLGSWQVIYNVPAFVFPIPILLTFSGPDGVSDSFGEVIETDSPAPTPMGDLGTLILSNGHGEWGYRIADGTYAYLYHKLIYDQNGHSVGVAHTAATVTPNPDGQHFEATLSIKFIDNQDKVVLVATGSATGIRIHLDESIDGS
jgi:hypothetical protein